MNVILLLSTRKIFTTVCKRASEPPINLSSLNRTSRVGVEEEKKTQTTDQAHHTDTSACTCARLKRKRENKMVLSTSRWSKQSKLNRKS
ncbi:CLUMA_CG001686, isoform A [Clunio marinus]|uniref:CLUMA_CG001686, isoform A n=1 Tax=Clunio marinus TaxID=568069 RepID=A0A1J1HJ04_9DIPT|nr:CLUMA_CG001686, isoform A [Clunio marinus]